jgi:hypothetical protein
MPLLNKTNLGIGDTYLLTVIQLAFALNKSRAELLKSRISNCW